MGRFSTLEQARRIVGNSDTITFKDQGQTVELSLPEDIKEQFLELLDWKIKDARFRGFFCKPQRSQDSIAQQKNPISKR